MSSRDFTHELHRTTKTLGYSKVIETLQSMAKIQPTGANDVPTTFRQHRSERDTHNTFGEIGTNFFAILQQDLHEAYTDKQYIRKANTSIAEPDTTITRTAIYGRYGIQSPHYNLPVGTHSYIIETPSVNMKLAANPVNTRITSICDLHVDEYITTSNNNSIYLDPMFLFEIRRNPSNLRIKWASEFHSFLDLGTPFGHLQLASVVEYDAAGNDTLTFYINGEAHATHAPLFNAAYYHDRNPLNPQFTYAGGPGMWLSHVSQFTQTNIANHDILEWLAADRAGVRDFSHADLTEWFTWRGYSRQLESEELPGAY